MSKLNSSYNQKGSVIIFTLLILSSMLAITLALLGIYIPKIKSVTDAGAGSVGAIYAADSALEWCIYTSRGNPALPQPAMSNGSTYTIKSLATQLPSNCPSTSSFQLNEQAVGTYRGISRSLDVTTP